MVVVEVDVVDGTVKRARSCASVSRMRETMSVEWISAVRVLAGC